MPKRTSAHRICTRRTLLGSSVASAVAAVLSVDAAHAGADDKAEFTLQPFDKVEPEKFAWGWIRWLMNARIDPQAEMTLGVVHIEPNQANPVHVHPNCTEYLHVLAGSCEHRVGGRWFALKAGDTLRIPKGKVHAARTKDQSCRVLVVYNTGTRQMVPVSEK